MTTTATAQIQARSAAGSSSPAARIALWVAQLLLAAQFASGGVLKLIGHPLMTQMFDTIGGGDGLRLLVGALEVAGAVGLLVPRLAGLAALGLVGLLIGASATNIAVLHTSPAFPLALLVVAGVVAYGRRHSTRRLTSQVLRRHH